MLIRVRENTVVNNTVRGIGWFTLKSYKRYYNGFALCKKQDWSLGFSDVVFRQLNLNY